MFLYTTFNESRNGRGMLNVKYRTKDTAAMVVKKLMIMIPRAYGQMLPKIQWVSGASTCCFHSGLSISLRIRHDIDVKISAMAVHVRY